MKLLKKQKIAALGLVEVLVVLAIVGVTMVYSMQLTISSYRTIRDNEVSDLASGFLIQGLEIAKSPQKFKLTNQFGQVFEVAGSYKLDTTSTPPSLYKVSNSTRELIQVCDQTYAVPLDRSIGGIRPDICLQIVLEPANEGAYKVTSRVVYPTSEEDVVRTFYGIRYGDFEL